MYVSVLGFLNERIIFYLHWLTPKIVHTCIYTVLSTQLVNSFDFAFSAI